jgi:chemotaxis protein histidine kinase CheA
MTKDAFEQRLALLRDEYRRELPARVLEVEKLWREVAAGAAGPARLRDLQRAIHSFTGSAEMFGFPELTESARAAEAFLEPFVAERSMPGPAEQKDFESLLASLQRDARQGGGRDAE